MPWKETNKMELKEQFITEMLKKEIPFSHLCKKYGISEKNRLQMEKPFLRAGKSWASGAFQRASQQSKSG